MSRFRITPARRDFLTLVSRNPLSVLNTGGRFVTYSVKGQISTRMSTRNFYKYLENDLLELAKPASKTGFIAEYRITPKGRSHVLGDI